MKIFEILTENYDLTSIYNMSARFHVADYYRHLVSSGAVNHHEKGILPADKSKWQHSCPLTTKYIEDENSNFYFVANTVTIEFRLSEVNKDTSLTYQDYLDKEKVVDTYAASFDPEMQTIYVTLDPMLLDPRENQLQFIIYRILMHEISHVYHYSRTLTNFNLGGQFPEQDKKYHLRSFEIDARYRDGWSEVLYFEKVMKRNATSQEAWEILKKSILRGNAYKDVSKKVIEKYRRKFITDFQEHLKGKK